MNIVSRSFQQCFAPLRAIAQWFKPKADRVRFVGSMERVNLYPGDHLVLFSEMQLSDETCERLKTSLETKFPGHPVTVLSGGLRLGVVSGGAPITMIHRDGMTSHSAQRVGEEIAHSMRQPNPRR